MGRGMGKEKRKEVERTDEEEGGGDKGNWEGTGKREEKERGGDYIERKLGGEGEKREEEGKGKNQYNEVSRSREFLNFS